MLMLTALKLGQYADVESIKIWGCSQSTRGKIKQNYGEFYVC